jgi:hypothetical protein
MIRAGDEFEIPSIGETWVAACDEDRGMVYAAGWPCSRIASARCRVITAATDAERIDMLDNVIGGADNDGDPRPSLARRQRDDS